MTRVPLGDDERKVPLILLSFLIISLVMSGAPMSGSKCIALPVVTDLVD